MAVGLSSKITRAQQCPTPSTPPPICNFDKSFCAASSGVTCSGQQSSWSLSNTVEDDVITGTQTQTSGNTTVLGQDSSSFTFIDGNNSLFDTYDLYAWPSTFEVANTGTFNLQGGTLTAGFEVINGVMNQSGSTTNTLVSYAAGPNSQGAAFHIHCSGTDNASCQSVVSEEDTVGSLLVSGAAAQYNLSGGTINAPILEADSGGTFNQTGGTVNILPNLSEDANQPTGTLSSGLYVGLNGTGTYNLSGGGTLQVGGFFTSGQSTSQAAGNEYIGYNAGSNGIFNQSGGNNLLGQYSNPTDPFSGSTGGNLYVGYLGNGTYNLSGGILANVLGTNEYIGYGPGSVGTFNQTGGFNGGVAGTSQPPDYTISQLYVGYMGHGNYTLGVPNGSPSNPELAANLEYIGTLGFDSATDKQIAGTGNFVQDSGENFASDELIVGNEGNFSGVNFGLLNPQGTYTLNGGQLSAGSEIIGDQSAGYFVQTGGSNTTQSLEIGFGNAQESPIGVYELSGGTLTVCCSSEEIGSGAGTNGLFIQSGGIHQTLEIVVGLGGGTGTYSLSSGLLDVGLLTVGQDAQNGGSGLFNQTGGTVSTVFTLNSNGTNFTSEGTIQVGTEANGTYNLGCTNGSASTCVGAGTLTSGSEEIGLTVNTSFTGTFNQYAGTSNTMAAGGLGNGALTVGADGNGVYNMYGGTLSAEHEDIGTIGSAGVTGTFNQSGGTNSVIAPSNTPGYGDLNVGDNGNGTYNLSGSNATTLNAVTENVGVGIGNGTFNQSGGVNNVSGTFTVGGGDESTTLGFYNLSGGALNATNEIVGDNFTSSSVLTQAFLQTGGANTVSGTLTIGASSFSQNAPGLYGLENGTLTAGNITVGSAGIFSINPGAAGPAADVHLNVTGTLTNNGTLDVFGTPSNAQIKIGTFLDNGTLNFDPLTLNVTNLTFGANSVVQTVAGDAFKVGGNFINDFNIVNTSLAAQWSLVSATLDFTGTSTHDLFMASTLNANNLAWGNLVLDDGGSLAFVSGSAGLYVDSLDLSGGLSAFADICGGSIFYDENDSANSSLFGGGNQGSYTNSCGGSLVPFLGASISSSSGGTGGGTGAQTPEPSTWLLLLTGLAFLSMGTWFRKFPVRSASMQACASNRQGE
ncbi:MAG: PEP-CTERM sorting domain-containing protein [Candidatus Acidiferrales bacterium]